MAFDSTEVAWRDLEVFLNGQRIGKIRKLKWKTTRTVEEVDGAGDDPVDINPGEKRYSGELEVYNSVVATMNKAAVAAGFDDLTDLPWVLVANFKATSIAPRQTTTLPNVRFEGFEDGADTTSKSVPITMTFKCMKPIRA